MPGLYCSDYIKTRPTGILARMTDENRDGKVTASELISPQTIVTFLGLLSPLVYWITANDKQAECDFAEYRNNNYTAH